MPPIYPPTNPSWDDTYDEQFQNNSVSYPCYDGTIDHMMGPAIYDDEGPGWSASHLNTPTETYNDNVSDAYTGNDPYHNQGGDVSYSGIHDQNFAPPDPEDPEPFDPSAMSSGSHNSDFSLTRANTMSTDTSIQPQQGSVDGSDSEDGDGRQQARRRDPVERYDAFSRFDPPLPVGSRYGRYASTSVVVTDDMLDNGSSEYLPRDRVKKKKGRKGEPKEMLEHSLSGGHHRRRKDHEDEGSASRQWSSKTDNR